MVDQDYVTALVDYGSMSSNNLQALQTDFAALYPLISAGRGREISSMTLPGQTISWSHSMTVQEQFTALSMAIKTLTGKPTVFRRTTARCFS